MNGDLGLREVLEASWGASEGRVSIWFRRSPGKGTPVNAQRWFQYPDQFDDVLALVESIKEKDVYFSPPIYDQDSRTPEHAVEVSTIWCDADLCDPSNFRLPPSRVLKTSAGNGDRWQCFWDLDEALPAIQASEIAHKIAVAHKDSGADQSSWPANKLMRIPGTANTNWGEWTVQEFDRTGTLYAADELREAYADIDLTVRKLPESKMRSVDVDVKQPSDLPNPQGLLEQIDSTEVRLMDLLFKEPKVGDGGWRSEHVWALLMDLFRYGFQIDEVVSLAWNAPATSKWKEDARGVEGLYAEATKAHNEVLIERGNPPQGAEAEDYEPVEITRHTQHDTPLLLSDDERKRFESRYTWDVHYLDWARTKIFPFNAPYSEGNLWVILAAALGQAGYVPNKDDRGPLSFYEMQLGGSSSGKTISKNLAWSIIRKLYPTDSPDIGGNHSVNALVERLLERDGKVSIIHADEAHGKFREMKSAKAWTTGIQETWTDVYGGKIPQLGRVGNKDLQRPDARGTVLMHMMGTLDGMLGVLDRDMFVSGYLARQVWVIGEDMPVTEDSVQETQAEEDDVATYEAMPKYWATHFANTRQKLRKGLKPGENARPMRMTREALERHSKLKWDVTQAYADVSDPGIYQTAIRRFGDNVRKAATLIAMARGSLYVTTDDEIVAIGYAEKWLAALDIVADGISDTFFSKQLDEIEKFIAGREGQEAPLQAIYVFRKEAKRVTDEYLLNLMSQGRITERQAGAGGPRYYRIRQGKKNNS